MSFQFSRPHTMPSAGPQAAFASTRDWEVHRPVITDLYEGKNMTLNEVMRYMESRHGFKATVKMYKNRIKQWGLRKNLRSSDVERYVQSGSVQGDNTQIPELRGRKASQQRITTYLRRKQERDSKRLAVASQVGPARPTPLRMKSNTTGTALLTDASGLAYSSLCSPHDFRWQEQCFYVTRCCLESSFDFVSLKLDSEHEDHGKEALNCNNYIVTALRLMRGGKRRQAYRIFERCNHLLYQAFLRGYRYEILLDLFRRTLEVYQNLPDLAAYWSQVLQAYSNSAYRASNHLVATFLGILCNIAPNKVYEFGRMYLEGYMNLMREYLPAHSDLLCNMVNENFYRLYRIDLIDKDTAVAAILANVSRLIESGRQRSQPYLCAKYYLAWLYYSDDDWTAMLRTTQDILSLEDSGLEVFSFYRTSCYELQFEMYRAQGNEHAAIAAGQKRIKCCIDEFGMADDRTIDTLNDCEEFLRERGHLSPANQTEKMLEDAIDELCLGVGKLEL
ncbi:hypothetical protein JX265_004892 [Neoarthrinium moseri]|uniref:Clr5 domain-containing protein n=1 Tax=Neoarthrinium moseri TaxID=1658444 RepID=A0A9P9WQ81_9PEZI|nr:uncharacterized protein JN550_003605 [Neoarthrinium moseri]KAI1872731.1 hypothetical protein JN550_003605 [Neoarthrinium moseri]KAI1874684.1 hypothetical protein JX265_004892 [Neoarthrinium moseri]